MLVSGRVLAGRTGASRLACRSLSTTSPRDVCIVAAARTPIGDFGGSLASVPIYGNCSTTTARFLRVAVTTYFYTHEKPG